MSEVKLTNTPYEDVFRTLLNDCSSLIIPVINEVFHERYSGKEEVVFSANEHFMNRQGGNEDERITDSNFKIVGTVTKKYHLECQSNIDSSMLVRLFEYDTQIALDEGEIKENVLTVTFPHSAVLYLRCNESTPDKMKIKMVTPGGEVTYDIPLMKSQQYTLDEIFEKRLLLPFYIFSHEKRFEEYENDETKLKLLQEEYELIKNRLEELMNQGEISEYMKCTISDMSNKVLEHIAVKYDSVKKGVQSVMGGKVLEYEAKTILNKGREEGREEGITILVSTLKEMNVPIQTILEKVQEKFNLSLETAKKYI
ncbi:hypothetical protein C817_01231 [Dorea sp. 5-2]|nr:hypothetical protein C817_01231 [Dorea sp. 5-2]